MSDRPDDARPFDKHCADFLADEVAVLVERRVVDMRSPAADALLDYRDPPRSPRSDRLAELERENRSLRASNVALTEALRGLFDLIERGVLVRDTSRDHEHGWAALQLPLIAALQRAEAALASVERT